MDPCVIIDPRTPEDMVKNLHRSGFETVAVPLTGLVDSPLSGHPDIQMFIRENNLFVHPDIDITFLKKIEERVNIIQCSSRLDRIYPGDIPYNIALIGATAIHRKNYTDSTIYGHFMQNRIEVVNTRQGYSKCSTLIVDDESIITSDRSINSAAEQSGIDSLLITPGYIDLPGYDYGFIGGASGKFLDTIYLTGSLERHPDLEKIYIFIESHNIRIKILSNLNAFDAGSLFFIN